MRFLAAVFVCLSFVHGAGAVAGVSTNTGVNEDVHFLRNIMKTASEADDTFSRVSVIKGSASHLALIPGDSGVIVIALDDQGRLTALNRGDDSGKVLWYVALADGRRPAYSVSLLYSQGVILCSIDNVLYGLDPGTGQVKWKSVLRNFLGGDLVLLNEGQSVAAFTIDGYLYVFDVGTGGLLWHREETGVQVRTRSDLSVAYSADKHFVVVVLPDGRVLCLDSYSGDQMWGSTLNKVSEGLVGRVNISPVIVGNWVFAADSDGALVGINLTTGESQVAGVLGVKGISKVDEESVFVVTGGDELLAIDAESKTHLWKLSLKSFRNRNGLRWNSPIMVGDKLWLMSSEGHFLGINAFSGALEESYLIPGMGVFSRTPLHVASTVYAAAGRRGLIVIS
ncbi:PQQ-binding-like beta-propeller repeat protein [Candidatus Anaplasma sp. TIGMIC]|uniref:PQQ-binding-like beta-propeller repeat protein n=1 Tax=Candidatus Anaplasma sp. TIGMIC TaxID=3020713 RepID=UPI00232F5E46|nr:PQQ-binding-like beta-propeller repeat protein [Candidatus Anaplasma sp. TIGMIC]MDB1134985.1 PQQ-like beta-propeller repeat protein [Candidatus Anaplasma sp. TIGMIC]